MYLQPLEGILMRYDTKDYLKWKGYVILETE